MSDRIDAKDGMPYKAFFKIPEGYGAWCHACAERPFNEATVVGDTTIPGRGFKDMDECTEHFRTVHASWRH